MKKLLVLVLVLSVSLPKVMSQIEMCRPEERHATICPPTFKPRCGCVDMGLVDNRYTCKSCPNRCLACATPEIEFTFQGNCPREGMVIKICERIDPTTVCPNTFRPVCGYSYNPPVFTPEQYSNPCFACKQMKTVYYVFGKCQIN